MAVFISAFSNPEAKEKGKRTKSNFVGERAKGQIAIEIKIPTKEIPINLDSLLTEVRRMKTWEKEKMIPMYTKNKLEARAERFKMVDVYNPNVVSNREKMSPWKNLKT